MIYTVFISYDDKTFLISVLVVVNIHVCIKYVILIFLYEPSMFVV